MKAKLHIVLEWARANLISVICLGVAIIALPTMYVLGSRWSAKQLAKVEADTKKQVSDLNGAKVEYTLEPVTPSERPFSISMPPNPATTEQMRTLLVRTAEQVGGVRERVVRFNRDSKSPLVDGLFPKPAEAIDEPALTEELAKRLVPRFEEAMQRHRAGPPLPPGDVEKRLKEFEYRERQAAMTTRADGVLTPEDEEELRQRLSAERMQIYLGRALELQVYADLGSFPDIVGWTETRAPTLDEAWERQWVFWVLEDLLRAVERANDGQSLIRGPVKRIEEARVEPVMKASGTIAADPTAALPRDFSASLSGRVGPNALYDIRMVDATLLVASDQAPRLMDSLASTNLITVVGCDISSVDDLPEHRRLGYVYSRTGEHISRVRLRIETLWLRDWTGPLMPEGVKSLLGFEGAAPPQSGEDGQQGFTPNAGARPPQPDKEPTGSLGGRSRQ